MYGQYVSLLPMCIMLPSLLLAIYTMNGGQIQLAFLFYCQRWQQEKAQYSCSADRWPTSHLPGRTLDRGWPGSETPSLDCPVTSPRQRQNSSADVTQVWTVDFPFGQLTFKVLTAGFLLGQLTFRLDSSLSVWIPDLLTWKQIKAVLFATAMWTMDVSRFCPLFLCSWGLFHKTFLSLFLSFCLSWHLQI